jgi:hypothetical protein
LPQPEALIWVLLRCLCRLAAKASIFISPDLMKSRKSSPRYLQVSQILRRIRYSRSPFSLVIPLIIFRSMAKGFTACSALLLFHGIPS